MKQVLRELMEHFELILFTSGSKPYAKAIITEVIEDEHKYFSHIITRESCLYDKSKNVSVKDL
jgi:TFIIF-interacting CTD phosphatase-like protein